MSQCDTAPFLRGAERERAARGRRRLRIVVDHELEGAEMALGGADRALAPPESRSTRGGATAAGGLISTVTSR